MEEIGLGVDSRGGRSDGGIGGREIEKGEKLDLYVA